MDNGKSEEILHKLEKIRKEYNDLSQHYHESYLNPENAENESPDDKILENHNCPYSIEVLDLKHQFSMLLKDFEAKDLKLKVSNTELNKVKDKNKLLKKDIDILKDIIKRINEQLNRYRLEYGTVKVPEAILNESIKKEISSTDLYKFSALLSAYDELIAERDDLIRSNTSKFDSIMVKVNEITEENDKLHEYIDTLQKEVTSADSKVISANARLLLEERDLMIEELKTIKQQRNEELAANTSTISKLKDNLDELQQKLSRFEKENNSLIIYNKQLDEKYYQLKSNMSNFVSKEDYQKAVTKCETLLEELKHNYNTKSVDLKHKVDEAKHEKKDMIQKINSETEKVKVLSNQVKSFKTSNLKNISRLEKRNIVIHQLTLSKKRMFSQLKYLAVICSNLLDDRSHLLEVLEEKKKELKDLSQSFNARSAAVGAINIKYKEEKLLWNNKIAESEGAYKAAKAAWKRSVEETAKLKALIHTKDDTISSLLNDRILGTDLNQTKSNSTYPDHRKTRFLDKP